MKIDSKHLLQNERAEKVVSHIACPKNKSKFKTGLPNTIIIHYTAGRSADSSAKYLSKRTVKASAHVVVARDRRVIQLVPFNTIAWHAGTSQWANMIGLNNNSIGIEIDNAGILEKHGDKFLSWFKREYPKEQVIQAVHRNESFRRYWHQFTDIQIELVEELCLLLMDKYPVKYILGHEEISPGRKHDPGPAFPLDKLRNRLLYNNRDNGTGDIFGIVSAQLLNIRSEASINASLAAPPIAKSTRLQILEKKDNWYLVNHRNTNGYVSANYVTLEV